MGLRCPKCNTENHHVIDSRGKGDLIWRRRECLSCGERFNTYEYLEPVTKREVWEEIKPELIANIRAAIIKSFKDD